MSADHELADYIRDQVCCPRIHGCELNGSDECPAERVRAALSGRWSDRDLAGALKRIAKLPLSDGSEGELEIGATLIDYDGAIILARHVLKESDRAG